MKYILDKDYFINNASEKVSFSRFSKVKGTYNIGMETFDFVSSNQDMLEELYKIGRPYVKVEETKKQIKKKKVNEYKKANSKQKEEQVLPEASEE
tara:strand:- start:5611 stop:5895 length:285 start_codon:yes stop_codon:yes gene_type:complete